MGYSYKKLYEKSAAYFEARPKAKKALPVLDKCITGAFGLAYIFLWVYAIFWGKFPVRGYVRIAFIPLLSLLCALFCATNRKTICERLTFFLQPPHG